MITEIDASRFPGFDNHEKVYHFSDEEAGLFGYLAIHSSRLGPATGGTRWWDYKNPDDALVDALMLSKAMTYKCALAGLSWGGGKAVIYSSPDSDRKRVLTAYGKIINELSGEFTTGTDVGITDDDTRLMAVNSKFILGQPQPGVYKYSTSEMAAWGVFVSLQAGYRHVFKKNNLAGARIAVKGVGKLGARLVELLLADGAQVIVADIDEGKVKDLCVRFPNLIVSEPEEIYKQEVDVYSPCALGGEFTSENASKIRAKMIAGGANNQLLNDEAGEVLHQRGVIYLPDYLINAGGLINIVDELDDGGYQAWRVRFRVGKIARVLLYLLTTSHDKNQPTHRLADVLAKKIINNKNEARVFTSF